MASPKLIDTDGLTVFKDECDKLYLQKVTLSAVATSGSYTDLSNKPTIPTVPTALKNPNALTFTGAVTGSYDGSAAKSVNIPAAQDLTPYMKKIADSDLDMRNSKLKFSTGTISYGLLGGQRPVLIIDASNSEGVDIKAPSVLVNESPIATKTDLSGKLDKTDTAAAAIKATQDGAGNVIATTYIKTVNNLKPDISGNVNISGGAGGNITVDSALSSTSTNAIQNRVVQQEFTSVRAAIPTKVSQLANDSGYLTQHQSLDGYVKSVNNTKPDASGNVTITVSGGGSGSGVSTSTQNTWTAQQNFQRLKFNFESFATSRISDTYDSPATSVATYNVTGALTLDMSTLVGMISNGDTSIFTAYIASNGSYALSITNAGTLKYAGSAADLAITASGLLLNIFLTKNTSGVVTSIAQATKLS